MDIPYQDINSRTIDRWVDEGWEWGKPISHAEYEKAQSGTWDVKLTPVKFVPHSWLGELKGKRVLGLASGGGQQMPIFAALGAQCTVLDYSQRQLDSEKLVAEREGYDITIVRADMTKGGRTKPSSPCMMLWQHRTIRQADPVRVFRQVKV